MEMKRKELLKMCEGFLIMKKNEIYLGDCLELLIN